MQGVGLLLDPKVVQRSIDEMTPLLMSCDGLLIEHEHEMQNISSCDAMGVVPSECAWYRSAGTPVQGTQRP